MNYWLFKSEAAVFGWSHQLAAGEKGAEWFGVRNYQARNNMRLMQVGDQGFFYHSVDEKRIVGVVEVTRTAHPDSTTDDARWECVDVRAVGPMSVPVTLDQIKSNADLAEMVLVKNTRLSVQPVTSKEWAIVCDLGGFQVATKR
jgi:predicted RNA-binding protein with PUA-like domain